ncbi:helix-turn-helix transcriptional regulator [bacterium]|nr:helix-turn-helix transcriptional regulator [bacterium]
MQYKDDKSLHLRKVLGQIIKNIREKEVGISCTKLADEYGINDSNLNKIERAKIDCKFITLWRIAEALGIKPSQLVHILEKELGDKFKLIDE